MIYKKLKKKEKMTEQPILWQEKRQNDRWIRGEGEGKDGETMR